MFTSPVACVYQSTFPLDPCYWDKRIPRTKIVISRAYYIMAFSIRFADSDRVVEAIFNNEFGFSDEEDSESDDGNDVFGYLGHSIVSQPEIIDAAGDLVEEGVCKTEDKTTADALMFSLDNSAIHDIFQDIFSDSEEPNENDMTTDSGNEDSIAIDNGEEIEFESVESSKQTVCEETLSSAESEVSGDKTN